MIRQHPGVSDVAVTGVPDPECGELPVACVVRRPGYDVTADEIKDIVKGKTPETNIALSHMCDKGSTITYVPMYTLS